MLAALKKDVYNIPYEAAVEGKIPAQATVELVSQPGPDQSYTSHHVNYYEEFETLEAFLERKGYTKELFLNPGDVESIVVKKTGSEESFEIKEIKDIKTLLNWGYPEDEKSFMTRQKQSESKFTVEYYGKIIRKNEKPIFVRFEPNPHAIRLISEMIAEN